MSWLSGDQSTVSDPVDPIGAQIILTLVAIRRELEKTFAYQNSTASPVQITQSLTGTVIGSVNLANRYGDTMAYTVATAPTQGTVVINSNGTFTYTPNAALQASGGLDQFTVTVRDTAFHLFGESGTITVPVSIAVTPPVEGIANPTGTGAHSVVISGDGKRAFVLNTDRSISVLDTDSTSATYNQIIGTVPVEISVLDAGVGGPVSFTPKVTALATNSAGDKVYFTSDDTYTASGVGATPVDVKRLSVLSIGSVTSPQGVVLLTATVTGYVDLDGSATGIGVSADESRVYVLGADEATGLGSVATVDPSLLSLTGASLGAVLGTTQVGQGGSAIGVDATGRVYVTNAEDDTVSVINPATNNLVTTIAVGGRPSAIAFGPGPNGNSSYAYVANSLSNSVSVIDTNPDSPTFNTVVASITVGGEPSGITVSPDGKHVYVAQRYTNSVAVIDTATNTLTTRLETTSDGGPTAVVAAADNAHVYVTHLYSSTITNLAVTPTLTPTPTATTPILGSTKGYKVYNLSSQAITLTGFASDGKLEQPAPGPGTVVSPGTYLDFEVVVYGFKDNLVEPIFDVPTAPGPITVVLYNVNTTRHIARCDTGGNQCEAIPGYKVAILDKPGSVITLDASVNSQAQGISQVLNGLCYDGSQATCNFTATTELATYTKAKQYGNALENKTDTPITLKTTATRTVTEQVQDSVQLTVGNVEKAIFEKVTFQVQVRFQHTWTEAKTFSQEIDMTIPPWKKETILVAAPILRDYGDFTLKMGNTTWNLKNVYFDEPDPNRGGTFVVTQSSLVPSSDANGDGVPDVTQ
ncbi:beta-propeller fold lactonase family protein [Mycobacterium sp. M26]|uniref:beta-propeller fold lactonase family protein n=1 Tax=Mycobacterium sp. M26 TaxID=1762962 RepID=UPI0012E3AEBF|nr:beta-propeller fold lactonase family protein [Mycobacterium sp. M26]